MYECDLDMGPQQAGDKDVPNAQVRSTAPGHAGRGKGLQNWTEHLDTGNAD